MRCHPITVCILAGITLTGLARPVSAAEAKSTKDRVASLLQVGWTRSIQARKDAQRKYDHLSAKVTGDWRIPYSYALVQIQQYRYADAAKLLDQALALDPRNVEANRLRLWTAVILKDYNKALARMRELADALPPEPTAAAADATNRDLAVLLGRLCGFMEGPVKPGVNQTTRAACAAHLDEQLTGSRRAALGKARRAVLLQFEAIDEEQDLTKAEAKQTGEKIKQHVVAELKQQAIDLSDQLDAEQARISDLRRTTDGQLDRIKSDSQSAGRQLQVQQAAAQQAGLHIRDADARLAVLSDLANRETDPNLRQQYIFDAAYWAGEHDRWAAQLAAANQLLAAQADKIRDLQQQRAGIDARMQRAGSGAAALESSLNKALRNQEQYEKKTVDANTPQTADQQRRSVALATYVPLPVVLDAEKERVIKLFDAIP